MSSQAADLVSHHPTVAALRAILPGATVAGGSFGHWLPHPGDLPRADRRPAFDFAMAKGRQACLRTLFAAAGSTRVPPASRSPTVSWPHGWVGSLTHKGTVVLGALMPNHSTPSLGIDLEHYDRGHCKIPKGYIAPEGLPTMARSELSVLLALSGKEAIFKAYWPLETRRLEFSDISVGWQAVSRREFTATGDCPSGPRFTLRCRIVGDWIVSAARPLTPTAAVNPQVRPSRTRTQRQ